MTPDEKRAYREGFWLGVRDVLLVTILPALVFFGGLYLGFYGWAQGWW